MTRFAPFAALVGIALMGRRSWRRKRARRCRMLPRLHLRIQQRPMEPPPADRSRARRHQQSDRCRRRRMSPRRRPRPPRPRLRPWPNRCSRPRGCRRRQARKMGAIRFSRCATISCGSTRAPARSRNADGARPAGPARRFPDERTALESEIGRLQSENAALKKELLARGLALPGGVKDEVPVAQSARSEAERQIAEPTPSSTACSASWSGCGGGWSR